MTLQALDAGVETIVSSLKESGLYDNSVIVFTTDNGGSVEHTSNYPLRGQKEYLYEGGIRGVGFVTGGALRKKTRVNDE